MNDKDYIWIGWCDFHKEYHFTPTFWIEGRRYRYYVLPVMPYNFERDTFMDKLNRILRELENEKGIHNSVGSD